MMTTVALLRPLLAAALALASLQSAQAARHPGENGGIRQENRAAVEERALIQLAQISIGGGGFQIGVGGYGGPSQTRRRPRYDQHQRRRPAERRRIRPGGRIGVTIPGTAQPPRRPRGEDRRRAQPRPDDCRRYGRQGKTRCYRRPRVPVIVITPPAIEEDHERDPPRGTRPPRKTATPKQPERSPRRRVATPPPPAAAPAAIPPIPAPRPTVVTALPDHWLGEVVVQLASSSPPDTEGALAQGYNLTFVGSEANALVDRRIVTYQFSGPRTADEVAAALASDPRVAGAQPNWRYLVSQGGGKAGAGQRQASLQYASMKLGLADAHALARGRGVRIAVIDSGVDRDHPALDGAVAAAFDAAGERGEAIGPHGTAIAGILKAQGLLKGVAPSADLLAVRAFFATETGGREQSSTAIIMRSLDWAVREKARIINMSFAGPPDAAVEAAVKAARAKGVILIAAAGNGGREAKPAYPAAYPDVIAVTATDTEDRLYDKANRGPYIDVAAPGVDIFVVAPAKAYKHSSGTSLAAAHVSGIVALLVERDASLDGGAIGQALKDGAADLGQPGPDQEFGAGRVDTLKLLQAAQTQLAAPAGK